MAVPRIIVVPTASEMEAAIVSYVSQGFQMTSRMPTEALLVKKKELSIPMLIIGLFLCVIPFLIYLVVYAAQKDQVVVIRLGGDASATATATAVGPAAVDQLRWSEDRISWWNGSHWIDVADELPPTSSLSDDKRQWWDGQAWRVVQQGARHPQLRGRR